MIEIVGHRGYGSHAPENTLRSLDMAIDAGADAVEWDVHVASCGTPVLFHDETLGRTSNGVGLLRRRSLQQLKLLDAGKWFGASFEGEPIPSLAEALERIDGRVSRAYCEVKGYRELEDLDRMVEIVRSAGMLGTVVFISLDWRIVERVAGRDPAVQIGFILDDPAMADVALGRVERRGRGFVDAKAEILLDDPRIGPMVRGAGVELGAWTVNDAYTADRLVGMGVTRITTDEVDTLLAWRDGTDDA